MDTPKNSKSLKSIVILLKTDCIRLLKEIDALYETTHKAWQNTVGGNLVALHLLQGV
ncbi:hypothetical protein RYA07_23775 [Pseudomonas syringae pv. actinidiae]|nr:hypothetical protein [Pseudomonas syringae]MDU8491375.1 hypothetical protein [Pseudomonas syringae pv. actinidiae]RMT62701.1 hypothetical protein ALP44_200020 [Pseudomonas syringae pv. theae]GAO96394.1 hypothetical protein PSA5_26770 [Pseudomonas syringae pv. actinidiae]